MQLGLRMALKGVRRVALWVVLSFVGLELVYLVAANGLLASGAIQRASRTRGSAVQLDWERAYSPWPGRVYARGYRLGLDDPLGQFSLTIERAQFDVSLFALLDHRFHASHVRAEGVRWKGLVKVPAADSAQARVAAFPTFDGLASPAVLDDPPPLALTEAQLDGLWNARLDDVDARLDELWVEEYHYEGPARVRGSLEYVPLRRLWVGATSIELDGGVLRVAEHLVSQAVHALVVVNVGPVDDLAGPGPRLLQTLSLSFELDAAIASLAAVELYAPSLEVRGSGRVAARVFIEQGKLLPGSFVQVTSGQLDVGMAGYQFSGAGHARFAVRGATGAPTVRGVVHGRLTTPLLGAPGLAAALSDVSTELELVDRDLTQGLRIAHASATLGEARITQTHTLVARMTELVPVLAPAVLGLGPLVATGSAYATPEYRLVRLKRLTLGEAELVGAAVDDGAGWRGVAAGHFGFVPVGLRLQRGVLESVLFAPPSWLGVELLRTGIEPQ